MKTLKQTFEDNNEEDQANVVFKGPLAEVCVDALRKVYAKSTNDNLDEDGDNVVIMESAELDAQLLSSISRMISTGVPVNTENTSAKTDVVYTVNKDVTDDQTLVDLTKELANHNEDEGRLVIVLDSTKPSVNGQAFSKPSREYEYINAIESFANAFNVPVYQSLKSFVLNYR